MTQVFTFHPICAFRRITRSIVVMVAASVVFTAMAQPVKVNNDPKPEAGPKPVDILAGRKDVDVPLKLLGERYENKLAGISFRIPAGTKESANIGSDLVAEFVDDANGWTVKLTKPTFPEPVPLTTEKSVDGKFVKTGLLDFTVDELLAQNPSAKMPLRKDVINVDNYYVGMIALCYTKDLRRVLRQQAIVQANDQLYYLLVMTSPAGSLDAEENNDKLQADPKVQEAIKSFVAMVDSVKILDRAPIKEDQNQRLFRTRSLMLLWKNPKKFESMRIEKQYVRYVQDGTDVGYSFFEELLNESRLSNVEGQGAMIYERTRFRRPIEKGNLQVTDVGAFKAVSLDMKHERWLRNITESDFEGPTIVKTESVNDVGESSWEVINKHAPLSGVLQPNDGSTLAPLMRPVDYHSMTASIMAKNTNTQTVKHELPPFYLPQAARYLLPRLVVDRSLQGERTYLFATYIPETRDIRMLYVDVSPEKKVTFNGQEVFAITVAERIGLAGSPTFHYVTSDGKYLGTEKPASKYKIIPSDEAELVKIWPTATLTRPTPTK